MVHPDPGWRQPLCTGWSQVLIFTPCWWCREREGLHCRESRSKQKLLRCAHHRSGNTPVGFSHLRGPPAPVRAHQLHSLLHTSQHLGVWRGRPVRKSKLPASSESWYQDLDYPRGDWPTAIRKNIPHVIGSHWRPAVCLWGRRERCPARAGCAASCVWCKYEWGGRSLWPPLTWSGLPWSAAYLMQETD